MDECGDQLQTFTKQKKFPKSLVDNTLPHQLFRKQVQWGSTTLGVYHGEDYVYASIDHEQPIVMTLENSVSMIINSSLSIPPKTLIKYYTGNIVYVQPGYYLNVLGAEQPEIDFQVFVIDTMIVPTGATTRIPLNLYNNSNRIIHIPSKAKLGDLILAEGNWRDSAPAANTVIGFNQIARMLYLTEK